MKEKVRPSAGQDAEHAAATADARLVGEQLAVPGTEKAAPKKRMSLLERAVVGDLLVAYRIDPLNAKVRAGVLAIEQVFDGVSADEQAERWKDQGLITATSQVEVWECRPGGYYRRRSSR